MKASNALLGFAYLALLALGFVMPNVIQVGLDFSNLPLVSAITGGVNGALGLFLFFLCSKDRWQRHLIWFGLIAFVSPGLIFYVTHLADLLSPGWPQATFFVWATVARSISTAVVLALLTRHLNFRPLFITLVLLGMAASLIPLGGLINLQAHPELSFSAFPLGLVFLVWLPTAFFLLRRAKGEDSPALAQGQVQSWTFYLALAGLCLPGAISQIMTTLFKADLKVLFQGSIAGYVQFMGTYSMAMGVALLVLSLLVLLMAILPKVRWVGLVYLSVLPLVLGQVVYFGFGNGAADLAAGTVLVSAAWRAVRPMIFLLPICLIPKEWRFSTALLWLSLVQGFIGASFGNLAIQVAILQQGSTQAIKPSMAILCAICSITFFLCAWVVRQTWKEAELSG